MIRWKAPSTERLTTILFNGTFALNCLLCFLWIFANRLHIPPWLQVAGRMHPLVLHFPIVLLVLFVLQSFFRRGKADHFLLLLAAFASALTAIAGLLLSREPGYDQDALLGHEYSGIAVSLLTFAWYACHERLQRIKRAPVVVAVFGLGLVILAGHLGSGITHGNGFLLAPLEPATPERKVALDEALVYTDMVKPILKARCMSCHNGSKTKGGLNMETLALILKGGKDGPVFDTTDAQFGLLMRRIHLLPDEKKHMPPAGKPQLEPDELAILYQWIRHDPAHDLRVADLPEGDTLRGLAGAIFTNDADENYDFGAAGEKTIAQLNTNYRVVRPVATGSPTLAVDFYGPAFFSSGRLKELEAVKTQVVSINLDRMPVTDADLKLLQGFVNLRTLQLGSTRITGNGLDALMGLSHLKSISVANTSVNGSDLDKLSRLPKLKTIYVWNTAVTAAEAKAFRTSHAALDIETGSRTDTIHLKLNPPLLRNDVAIIDTPIDLRLKHYVPGAVIRYTLDGSEPDSVHSPVYTGKVKLSTMAMLKARAYKTGWLPSDLLQYQFYHAAFKPDTVVLSMAPDSLHKGKGSKTLYNDEKGDLNWSSDKWLGFHKRPMVCVMHFARPVEAGSVVLSSVVDRGSFILPPQSIAIYGGNDPAHLRKLARLDPQQPDSTFPSYLTYFECRFKPSLVSYIRIEATPVAQLPKKLVTPKDKAGWFFVDELFVN